MTRGLTIIDVTVIRFRQQWKQGCDIFILHKNAEQTANES